MTPRSFNGFSNSVYGRERRSRKKRQSAKPSARNSAITIGAVLVAASNPQPVEWIERSPRVGWSKAGKRIASVALPLSFPHGDLLFVFGIPRLWRKGRTRWKNYLTCFRNIYASSSSAPLPVGDPPTWVITTRIPAIAFGARSTRSGARRADMNRMNFQAC
jgi:hypothetical protein